MPVNVLIRPYYTKNAATRGDTPPMRAAARRRTVPRHRHGIGWKWYNTVTMGFAPGKEKREMKKKSVAGRAVALAILAVAVCAVFTWERDAGVESAAEPVRPVKSMVVGETAALPPIRFPGILKAADDVDLSFEVSGRIVEFPVVKGQDVKKGDLIARLDPTDFDNRVKEATASRDLAKTTLEKFENALRSGGVSQHERDKARADLDRAEANLRTVAKAREDSELRAKFDGTIAQKYADNFGTVAAGRPVVRLQNIESFQIEISVPERDVVYGKRFQQIGTKVSAVFDSIPGVEVPAEFKDFVLTPDPATLTYKSTFNLLGVPRGVNVVPGMTATLVFDRSAVTGLESAPVVPLDAIGRGSDGSAFVWKLVEEKDGVYAAERAAVTLGERVGSAFKIDSGLSAGDRIALAGVSVLTEGRRLRLLEDSPDAIKVDGEETH